MISTDSYLTYCFEICRRWAKSRAFEWYAWLSVNLKFADEMTETLIY